MKLHLPIALFRALILTATATLSSGALSAIDTVYIGDSSGKEPIITHSLTGNDTLKSYHVYSNGNLKVNGSGEFSSSVTGNGMLTIAEDAEKTFTLTDGDLLHSGTGYVNGIGYLSPVYERILTCDKSIVINVEGTSFIGSEEDPMYNRFSDHIMVSGELSIYYEALQLRVDKKYELNYISTDTFTLNGGTLNLNYSTTTARNQYNVDTLIVNKDSILNSIGESSFYNSDPSVGPTSEIRINQITGEGDINLVGKGKFSVNIFKIESSDNYTGDIVLSNGSSNCPYWTETFNMALLQLSNCELNGSIYLEQYTKKDPENRNRVVLNIATDVTIGGLSDNSGTSTHLSSGTWLESTTAHTNDMAEVFSSFYTEEENTLTINARSDYTFNGKVYGSLNLKKIGAGQQCFAGDMSDFNGFINVQKGSLLIEESLTAKSTTISGASLSSAEKITTGTMLTMTSGMLHAAEINSMSANFYGSNTIDASAISGKSWTLYFDENNSQQAVINFFNTSKFNISTLSLQYASNNVTNGDEYVLLKFDTDVRNLFSKIAISGSCSETTVGKDSSSDLYFTTEYENGETYYTLVIRVNDPLLPPRLKTATWCNLTSDSKWNTTSKNWKQGDYQYAYSNGVEVIFTDEASGRVILEESLTPSAVTVNNSSGHTYTWSGSGSLTGNMTLTKQGTGTLSIGTANTYTGGTYIHGGTLAVQHKNALGTGRITLAGATLDINNLVITNDISVQNGTLTDADKLAGKISVLGNLTLNNKTHASGGIEISKGSVMGGAIENTNITVEGQDNITISSSINGSSALLLQGGTLTLSSSDSTYSGGTTIKAGTVTTGSATALGSGGITLEGGTLNLSGKSLSNTLTVTGDAVVNGGSAYNGALVLENGKLTGEALRLGKNATVKSGSIANVLTGTGKVTKSGEGTVTLSGANTYSGSTAINGGTLVAGHASALGSGAVSITGGTLNMNGKALSNTLRVNSGNAQILNGGSYTGNLSLSGGTLSVEGGDMDCNNLTLSGGCFLVSSEGISPNSPLIEINGTLTISQATQIGFSDYYALGTHVLFDFGNLSGSISNLTLIPQSGKTLEYEMYIKGNQVLVDIKTAGALLKWQEATGTWSVGGSGWQQGKKFEQGDQAVFSQAAKVTLQGNLAPGIIEVNGTQAVEFSGPGSITGTADLTKKGNGVLTLNPANPNWKGDIYLKGGTITATGNTSFGKGDIHASSGTLNLAGKAIQNDIYVSTTSSGHVCISGGNKYTGSVDVKGNLSGKTVLQIAEGETLTLHGGKHSATITGQGTMHIADDTVTLQTGKYTMSGLKISGKLAVKKQGLALAKTNSTITIEDGGSLNSTGKIGGCALTMNGGTISMNNNAPTTITLTGAFEANADSKVYLYGAFKSNSFTMNGAYFRMYGEKPQAITIAKEMHLIGGKGLTTTGNITAGSLVVDNTKLTINGPKAASLTLKDKTTDAAFTEAVISIGGKLTAAAGIKLTDSTLTLADPTVKNAPQTLTVKGKLSLLDGSVLNTNGKVSAASLEMDGATLTMSNAKPQSLALTGKTDALKQPITSNISNSTLLLNGSMSVAANLQLNNATIQLRDANTTKPKALGLTVKGDLTLGGNSLLYLSGALSAKNLTLGSGSIYMTGEKQQTIKVSNELTLNGGTDLNFGFSITQKDFDKNKAFKIITFKVLDAAVEAADLYSLLGLSEDICTLAFDKSRKSITLVVDDMDAWNAQAEAVRKGEVATAVEATEAAEEAEDMLFTPTADTAALEPDLAKVADTLVQSTWGTVGASRAFADTIANRGAHGTLLDDGKGAAWISTMGGSSRISSDGAHAGADYTLTGAAFGMEAHITDASVLGLAVGNSWGKVSTFSAYPVDQDSTHMGIYGNHKLNDTLTLSWMAAHTRTESDVNLAGLPCSWSQDALQLDARLTWAKALTARTTVNAFGGLQYLATDSGECNGIKTGSMQNLRAEIGVGATHQLCGSTLAYGELSFVGDMVRNNPTADLGGIRSHGTNPGRAGMNLSVGASHRLNNSWSVNASYNFELMQNITSHSLNIGATYSF